MPRRRGQPELACIQVTVPSGFETQAPARGGNPLRKQFGKRALGAHAAAEGHGVVAAATHVVQPAHDVPGPERIVVPQPIPEQHLHLLGQAQQHAAGPLGARPAAASRANSSAWSVSTGTMGATTTPQGTPAAASAPKGSMPRAGLLAHGSRRRATPWSRVVTDRSDQVAPSHGRENAEISQHQRVLGDHGHRACALGEHFQHRAGDAAMALGGLVDVAVGAHGDGLRPVEGPRQLRARHLRGVRFGIQPGLEVEPQGEIQSGAARPGVAVDAAVLAASIGIGRKGKRHAVRVVARHDAAGKFGSDCGAQPGR